jgi:hypothetical protein
MVFGFIERCERKTTKTQKPNFKQIPKKKEMSKQQKDSSVWNLKHCLLIFVCDLFI